MLNVVQLDFDPNDDTSFPSSREEILAEFRAWFVGHERTTDELATEVASDVGIALEWKWAYQDGNLAWWRTSHVMDYLLEWCPRQLSVKADQCDGVHEALAHWIRFLDANQLLSTHSQPVAQLLDVTEALRDDFIAAMGDPSKFGTAKTLFTLGTEAGVDMSDPDQIGAFIQRFNDLSLEERRALLPDDRLVNHSPATFDRRLAPVVVPTEDELRDSLARVPILSKFRDLAAYLGEGKMLTKKGHLKLADARELVELLDTGDVMDPRYGNATLRTTSSDNLRSLRVIVAWAKKAGVVRVLHGRLVTTKRGRGFAQNLTKEFDHVIDAVLNAGPLAIQSWPDQWGIIKAIWNSLDDMSIDLLMVPFVLMDEAEIELLVDIATSEVLAEWRFGVDDDTVRRYVSSAVNKMVDVFELGGLVTRTDAHTNDYDTGREGGQVALTPAGVTSVRRVLISAGFDVPIAGQFVALGASQLLEALIDEDEEVARAEVLAWCKVREPSDAVGDIARAITELDDPVGRINALGILSDIDATLAATHVWNMTARPDITGFALGWLADHQLIDESDLWGRAAPLAFVDVLIYRMLTAGPDGLHATLDLVGDEQSQCSWIETAWRAPSPSTAVVLTGIDQTHPSKTVRKAARKALFKLRSSSSAV